MLTFEYSPQSLSIFRSGQAKPLLTQNAATDKRPFIHPILAPDGVGELTENEPPHHRWQHGLYVGLNDVNGYGFWTEGLTGNPRDGTFHPYPLEPPSISENRASWQVVTDWKTPDGEVLLTEKQSWSCEVQSDTFTLDLDWNLRCHSDLKFGQSPYGGLFLRMPWRPETHGAVLTSEGLNSTETAEGNRACWIALSMPIPSRENGPAGFAFFEHPSNPEFPNPWRVDENFGIAPSRSIVGSWLLAEGESVSNRYRLLVFTGEINAEFVQAQWSQFSDS